MTKNFKNLTEREILALAITLEEEDGRIYGEFAQGLMHSYPATAKMLAEMQAEDQATAPVLLISTAPVSESISRSSAARM